MSIASAEISSSASAADDTAALLFPSVAWFQRLAGVMEHNEETFRELGPLECTMVVQVDKELFEIVFLGYAATSVRKIASKDEATPSHFVLEGPKAAWREMVENIQANGAPDLEHTLNYLTFPDVPLCVTGPDQLEIDTFYRYAESIQRFVNGAADVPTRF